MPYPSGTWLSEIFGRVRDEFEALYAQLEGFLSAEHNGNGTHGAVTVSSLTTSGPVSAARVLATGTLVAPQITANQNNYNPFDPTIPHISHLRVSSDAARDITGLVGGADGRLLFLSNGGGFDITLKNNSASSSAGNKFVGANGSDVVMRANNGSVLLRYDNTISGGFWFVIGA